MGLPRYTGIPTFMRTPYRETARGLDIALVGVPYDGGVTNRPGARHGPREVRNQSSLTRMINQATGVCPYELCMIGDVGDAVVERPFQLEGAHQEIQDYYKKLAATGAIPLSVGGDHSISLPILRVLARERPVGLIQIDAHCDTGDDYLGSRFHHGAPFSRAVDEGLLDPKRCVQIGIRGGINSRDQWAFSYEHGMRVIQIHEAYEMGLDAVIAGTPEIGGFTALEAQLLVRGMSGANLIGGDVVEVSPPFDPSGITALTGATIMFEMLCVLAQAVAARKS